MSDLYVTPLSGDYRDPEKLTQMFGANRWEWPLAVLKEVVDDLLDAADEAGIPPVIRVTWASNKFTIASNAPDLPFETLQAILDYRNRASTRAWRVEPSRGRLGFALKAGFAACAVDGGSTEVETGTYRVRIDVGASPEGGTDGRAVPLKKGKRAAAGTRFTFRWPGTVEQGPLDLDGAAFDLLRRYALVTPQARWEFARVAEPTLRIPATDQDWPHYVPGSPVDPHWHTNETLAALVSAEIDSGRGDRLIGDFLEKVFAGYSRKPARDRVLAALPAGVKRLRDLCRKKGRASAHVIGMLRLRRAMQFVRPIPARRFGVLGERHVAANLRDLFRCRADPKAVRYALRTSDRLRRRSGEDDDAASDRRRKQVVPFIVEAALGLRKPPDAGKQAEGHAVVVSVNGSVTRWDKDGIDVLEELLGKGRVHETDPVVVLVRVMTPRALFGGPSKSILLTGKKESPTLRGDLEGCT